MKKILLATVCALSLTPAMAGTQREMKFPAVYQGTWCLTDASANKTNPSAPDEYTRGGQCDDQNSDAFNPAATIKITSNKYIERDMSCRLVEGTENGSYPTTTFVAHLKCTSESGMDNFKNQKWRLKFVLNLNTAPAKLTVDLLS